MTATEEALALKEREKDLAWEIVGEWVRDAVELGTFADLREAYGAVRMAYVLSSISEKHKKEASMVLHEALKGGEINRENALNQMRKLGWPEKGEHHE